MSSLRILRRIINRTEDEGVCEICKLEWSTHAIMAPQACIKRRRIVHETQHNFIYVCACLLQFKSVDSIQSHRRLGTRGGQTACPHYRGEQAGAYEPIAICDEGGFLGCLKYYKNKYNTVPVGGLANFPTERELGSGILKLNNTGAKSPQTSRKLPTETFAMEYL
jgi:hypothetical protein